MPPSRYSSHGIPTGSVGGLGRFVCLGLWTLALLPPKPLFGQDQVPGPASRVSETINVNVLEINVVVTDRYGIPIGDLAREDFRLLVDGHEVPIDYFTSVEEGEDRTAQTASAVVGVAPEVGSPPAASSPDPVLAIFWDAGSLEPQDGKEVLAGLDAEIGALSEATSGMMVVQYTDHLEIVQPLTRSPELVRTALGSLSGAITTTASRARRRSLMRELEAAVAPGDPDSDNPVQRADFDVADSDAHTFYNQIEQQANLDRRDFVRRMTGLSELVASLGALEGRKELLYVGAGIDLEPGGLEMRLFEAKYRTAFPDLVTVLQSDIQSAEMTAALRQLTAQAARQQVVFHTINAARRRGSGRSAESHSAEVDAVLGDQSLREGELLATLAGVTGGETSLGNAKPKALLDRVRSGLDNYYSLGFTIPDGAPSEMKIRVEVDRPKLKLRYFRNISRDLDRSLETKARGALLASNLENPLRAHIEALKAEPIDRELLRSRPDLKGASAVLSFLIQLPVAELVLLPQGDKHVARVTVVVAARGPGGGTSEPIRKEVPFAIGNDKLLQAMAQDVAVPVQMAVGGGEQEVVVVLEDTIGERSSTLRFSNQPSSQ